MITIEYIETTLLGEPGPNVYFMGTMADFKLLKEVIGPLLLKENAEVCLGSSDFITIGDNLDDVCFVNHPEGRTLTRYASKVLMTNLPTSFWARMRNIADELSKRKCHAYIEFEDFSLVEDCNMMWSSEW